MLSKRLLSATNFSYPHSSTQKSHFIYHIHIDHSLKLSSKLTRSKLLYICHILIKYASTFRHITVTVYMLKVPFLSYEEDINERVNELINIIELPKVKS